jgi:stage V sporulation protein G
MNITSVRVSIAMNKNKSRPDSSEVMAFASIVFDNILVISKIRVIKSETGKIIVSMPSSRSPSGEYRDLAYPIDQNLRTHIDKMVIDAMNEEIVKKSNGN